MKERGRWDPAAVLVRPPTHAHRETDRIHCFMDDEASKETKITNMIANIEKLKWSKFVDDLTGQIFDERLVKKARQLET